MKSLAQLLPPGSERSDLITSESPYTKHSPRITSHVHIETPRDLLWKGSKLPNYEFHEANYQPLVKKNRKDGKKYFLHQSRALSTLNHFNFEGTISGAFRVATLNVELFKQGPEKIAQQITLLQEIRPNHLAKHLAPLGMLYPYQAHCSARRPNGNVGNAIISKRPLENIRTHQLQESYRIFDRCIVQATIGFRSLKEKMTVFTTHLPFGNEREAKRLKHLHQLHELIRTEQIRGRHVVLGGDFNMDLEHSNWVFPGLYDTFERFKKREHHTQWRGRRIDFIFVSNEYQTLRAGSWYSDMSDHWAQLADLKFNLIPEKKGKSYKNSHSLQLLAP
jgi:endonuclease/exonuclease/phosphatase family metal-dependent hydrolase